MYQNVWRKKERLPWKRNEQYKHGIKVAEKDH
jgi:hypothetical protein